MIKLADIPNEIIQKIKSLRVNGRRVELYFANKPQLLKDIKDQYQLTNIEVGKHIQWCQEFAHHTCKMCGKQLRYSNKTGKFPTYCSAKCSASDPDKKKLIADTCMKKYGTTSYSKSKEGRKKLSESFNWEAFKRSKQTLKERYGVEYGLQSKEIFAKTQASCKAHFGVENPVYSYETQQKIQQTVMQKYGVKSTSLIPEVREKQTRIQRLKYYHLLKDKCAKNPEGVEPLFDMEEYLAHGGRHLYKWKCKKCGEVFDHHCKYNIIPVCRKCHPIRYRQKQHSVAEWIRSIYCKPVIEDARKIIHPKELDIYLPDIQVAIEFNGTLWHSEQFCPNPNYHLNKILECEKRGIHLVHIWETDWDDPLKQEIIKTRLSSVIGGNPEFKSVYARNCYVEELETRVASEFVNNHHLQGYIHASVRLGLFTRSDHHLIAVMTFGRPRFSRSYQWELLRYCSEGRVVGGASKLLTYFDKKYNPESIVSYADRSWSTTLKSNLYERLGFILQGQSSPSYKYIRDNEILSRYQCQKHKLKTVLGENNFDPNLSETENMMNNGYVKIYDCGNLVYVKTSNRVKESFNKTLTS